MRYEEIYYGDILTKRESRTPGFLAQLRTEGWVPRPEHSELGTYSRPNNKRAVIDRDYVYIFNHWYDGTRKQAFPYGDPSYQAMVVAAKSDSSLAARVDFLPLSIKGGAISVLDRPGLFPKPDRRGGAGIQGWRRAPAPRFLDARGEGSRRRGFNSFSPIYFFVATRNARKSLGLLR